ncbi:MAG: DUF4252 domain-containing protein [Bacteroidia bacterium]|nr:DUF4252 domain-containing protein [Bacteroidia bacterium]
MKKILVILTVITIVYSCGTSRSFQNFYDSHKSDLGVTAFQVPNFMKSILSNITPKQNLFDNLSDFKFITFNNTTSSYKKGLIDEMNLVAGNRYTDMFRKNTVENTKIISVKEFGNVVTEAIVFDSKVDKTTIFYIKGKFDPEKIKAFSDDDTFDDFSKNLQKEYQMNYNPTLNPSFNPNN